MTGLRLRCWSLLGKANAAVGCYKHMVFLAVVVIGICRLTREFGMHFGTFKVTRINTARATSYPSRPRNIYVQLMELERLRGVYDAGSSQSLAAIVNCYSSTLEVPPSNTLAL